MLAFCERLREYQPQFVLAYANTLALFARFVRKAGLTPMRPKAIICSGEFLTAESRELIESTFGCPVFNRYGSREFSVIASECDQHTGMHVNAENLLVEVVVNGVPSIGQEGEIVVTDLRNRAMPLIRYQTRDDGPPRCRRVPLRTRLAAAPPDRRADDGFPDGRQRTAGLRHRALDLRDYGYRGHPAGAVRSGAAGGGDGEDRARTGMVGRKPRRAAGPHPRPARGNDDIETEFVDRIPLEASGKYRFSVSRLSA